MSVGVLAESSAILRTARPGGRWGLLPPSVASGEVGGNLPELRGMICRLREESIYFWQSWESAASRVCLL